MTDPRAALAEFDSAHSAEYWNRLTEHLAERGVLLVPADVVQAVADYPWGLYLAGTPNEQKAIGLIERLRAALSEKENDG